MAAECVALVRDRIGPVAAFRHAVVVDRLPKTRSGKILRGTMSRIADGLEWKPPATIDDPLILDEIVASFAGAGLSRSPPGLNPLQADSRFRERPFTLLFELRLILLAFRE